MHSHKRRLKFRARVGAKKNSEFDLNQLHQLQSTSRRTFLKRSLAIAGVSALGATAVAPWLARLFKAIGVVEIGSLRPMKDESTGLELLQLPPGFRYLSYAWTGDPMDGGLATPPAHDGMGVIASNGSITTMCRNHELLTPVRRYGKSEICYDESAGGGCVNLDFDTNTGKWLRSWPALTGTVRNCAGGTTPWNTWLSGEETLLGPGDLVDGKQAAVGKAHGWIFEVGPLKGRPEPLKAMGRFCHEAVAIDPATGIAYETEDRNTAGFYRFIPNVAGNLSAGGKLQMLRASGAPDLRSRMPEAKTLDVTWVDIDDPERAHSPGTTDTLGVFAQGKAKGATTFARLEGCTLVDGFIYFSSTSGGTTGHGEIWRYDPRNETLALVFTSPSFSLLDSPDNIVAGPHGALIVCQDGDTNPQLLYGLMPDGQPFPLAANNVVLNGERNKLAGDFRREEWCGATFSHDGQWLFVNIQTPGITFAITGPWSTIFSGPHRA